MIRFFVILCLLLAGPAGWARQGALETRDGKVYQGVIRLYPNSLMVANAKRDLLVHVDSTNLLELTFSDAPDPTAMILEKPFVVRSPDGKVPFPWKHEDIGSVQIPGWVDCFSGVFRMYSSGTNILEGSDAFHFMYRSISGDSEMVARVAQVQRTSRQARTGLMMREKLGSDSRQVMIGVTSGQGGFFEARLESGASAIIAERQDFRPPYWIRLRREGNLFSGYKSVNGRNWTLVEETTLNLPQDLFVGLASSGFREDMLTRAMLDNVQEGPSIPLTSFVPRVQLLSGSNLGGRIGSADDAILNFLEPGRSGVSTPSVAHVLFQYVPARWSWVLNSNKRGVLLMSGEFIDGDFVGIENGRVKISSILHGLRTYRMDSDVIALVLRKPLLAQNPVEIKTTDGSAWVGTDLEIADNEIVLREPALGSRKIPIYELAEVRWLKKP